MFTRKNKHRMLFALMAFVMTVGLVLSGCSNNASPTGTAASSSASTPAATSSTSTSAPAEPQPPEKAGKISILVSDTGVLPASEGDFENNRWINWVRENAPVEQIDLVVIPRAELEDKMIVLMASGSAPDLFSNSNLINTVIQKQQVLEITDEIIDRIPYYKDLIEKYPMIKDHAMTAGNGKMYAIGSIQPMYGNHNVVVRTDWLENVGLGIPTTVEELYEVLYAFTYNDPDGNGADDTYGCTLTTDAQRILSHMYGYANPWKYVFEEGEFYYPWDRIESWVEFAKRLVDNKLVNPDFLIQTATDDRADFLNGKFGVFFNSRFSNTSSGVTYFMDFKANFPDCTLVTFQLPETEYGQFTPYINGGSDAPNFINAAVKDLDAVISYLNWCYDPEVNDYMQYGPEGLYYQKDDEGTYVQVCTDEVLTTEFNYKYGQFVSRNSMETAKESGYSIYANMFYNRALKSDNPLLQEFGDLFYGIARIPNESKDCDPRKWMQSLPPLPTDLALIRATADPEVDNLLLKGIADSSKTAAQVAAEAKEAWVSAGGETVDSFYADYYINLGDDALTRQDFADFQMIPELLDSAKANSERWK
ncbi:MAG: hypothetical protein ACOX8S_01270 [Christensenellales bacterium]|jgi:putative aldouronate transport system substrate-binding protein